MRYWLWNNFGKNKGITSKKKIKREGGWVYRESLDN